MELPPSCPQQVECDFLAIRLFHSSCDKVGIFRPAEAAALIKAANETDAAHKGKPKSKLGGETHPVPWSVRIPEAEHTWREALD